MQVRFPYGHGYQVLEIPEERVNAVLRAEPAEKSSLSQEEIVRRALLHPIGSPRLCELARGKKRILLITSDHTRPVPSRITLPLYLNEIRQGAPDAEITILIATGMHRATMQEEIRAKFGDEIAQHEHIVVHRSGDESELAFFGTLPSGGELWLNKRVKDADLVVSEGFIEPHFFAGFSGGRKSILPGIAASRTVMYNHNAGFIRSPLSRQGILDGNPIHRDMCFAAKQAGLAFILNVILDEDKRIVACVAGDADEAHRAGCEISKMMTAVPAVPGDIVITSNGGYPLDQNIYQSVKGMTAAESCVKDGGAIIMCAAVGDGVGGNAFYHWFADRNNASEVMRDIENVPPEQTTPDQWQAQILARVMNKAECWFVTGEENRDIIERMHMHYAPDVTTALKEASARCGQNTSVTLIPDGVGVIVTEG